MDIKLAKTAGFCFGVARAVDEVERLLLQGKKICTLGPLIHNPTFVATLEGRGARVVDSVDDVKEGEILVIRSHGVDKRTIDRIQEKNIVFFDATCPFVAKIHKIVSNSEMMCDIIIIVGDKDHPEVNGIVGHAEAKCIVLKDSVELQAAIDRGMFNGMAVKMVVQTTYNTAEWEKCIALAKKHIPSLVVYDTVCKATQERQSEAETLAKECDTMLVIGGHNSSNTCKLADICSQYTRTYHIEGAEDIPRRELKNAARVCVTAGASTPGCIIKEVLNSMSEVMENNSIVGEELDFAAALEDTLKTVHNGDIVKGVVVGLTPTEVQVEIGAKYTGYVAASEFGDTLPVVNDELNLVAVRTNDIDGTVVLSKRKFDSMKGWKEITEAYDSGAVIEGKIDSAVNGGVIAIISGSKVFIPASLCSLRRIEDLTTLIGNVVRMKIIKMDNHRRRVVGSVKDVEREERKAKAEQLWETIDVGNTYTGIVKSMTSFGAFVDIGGADGMIHVSELSWTKISDPSKVLSVGQEVEVFIKAVDKEKKKISLGYRKDEDNPWTIFTSKYAVGDVVNVEIVSIMSYGAFARIIPGVDGLIHISQLANSRVSKVDDIVKVGDKVDVKIVEIDADKPKKSVSLSIRALLPEEEESSSEEAATDEITE